MNTELDQVTQEDIVTGFWILATCECGIFASADLEFCLYCIGGNVFVHHAGCEPQPTSYHEDRCPRRDADFDRPAEETRSDAGAG